MTFETVFSFGVILHEMITGEIPYRSLKDIVSGKLPKLPEDALKSFSKISEMMIQCTKLDPMERPTAAQLLLNYISKD